MSRLFILSFACLAMACVPAEETAAPVFEAAVENEAQIGAQDPWVFGGMVAAADRRAVEAGVAVLEAGGHAVDAAIAVHSVLGLVEPQSSGLGGGAFMLVYERESGEITVFDGRETAPAYVTPRQFYGADGEAMDFVRRWQSGRSVGVPGQVALYKSAYDQYGALPWADLFSSAIMLAEDGFIVSPRLAGLLASERLRAAARLDDNPGAKDYFYPGGEPLKEGDRRTNPDYAQTLRDISVFGPEAFYSGRIAEAMLAAVNAEPDAGSMTLEDIAGYEVKTRAPLCGPFKTYRICSAPPPSSGGVVQPVIMGLYERLTRDLEAPAGPGSSEHLLAFVDAMRLAYADRDHYVADADHVAVPAEDLMHPLYLDARIGDRFAPEVNPKPGDPGEVLGRGSVVGRWGRDTSEDAPGTTHISIIDRDGNAVSMTATVEAPFGSSRWAAGFLMNNELTDFAAIPEIEGKPVANAPAPGKRPRSSMSPTLVFDEAGELFMVTGSPGGNSIIAYVAKTLVGVLDWGLSAQAAIDRPNIIARGKPVGVEVSDEAGQNAADLLRAQGYNVVERQGENSGLHVIIVREGGLEGGADKRREGAALPVGLLETAAP